MKSKYLFFFAQSHHEFRIPEIQSLCELYGFEVRFIEDEPDPTKPFMIIELEKEEHAELLAKRSVLIKWVICSSTRALRS